MPDRREAWTERRGTSVQRKAEESNRLLRRSESAGDEGAGYDRRASF